MSKQITETIKNTYLSLYEILDAFQEENKRSNVGAMKHVKGIFVAELIIPTRKRLAYNYITNFFFYEILEMHENFIRDKISARELPSYILGLKSKCNCSYYFDKLEKCYLSDSESEESVVKVYLKDEHEPIEEKFVHVNLDMLYILEITSKALIKYMRRFWKKVNDNAREEERIEAYSDYYACLTVYEIFLRRFSEQTQGEYEEYSKLLFEAKEACELLNSEDVTKLDAARMFLYFGSIDLSRFSTVEEINRHVVLYTAALQGIAMIEILNLDQYNVHDYSKFLKQREEFPESLFFDKNGNHASSIIRMTKELLQNLMIEEFFAELPLHRNHITIRKLFELFECLLKNRNACIVCQTNDGKENELYKIAREIAFPLLERNNHILVIK